MQNKTGTTQMHLRTPDELGCAPTPLTATLSVDFSVPVALRTISEPPRAMLYVTYYVIGQQVMLWVVCHDTLSHVDTVQ